MCTLVSPTQSIFTFKKINTLCRYLNTRIVNGILLGTCIIYYIQFIKYINEGT